LFRLAEAAYRNGYLNSQIALLVSKGVIEPVHLESDVALEASIIAEEARGWLSSQPAGQPGIAMGGPQGMPPGQPGFGQPPQQPPQPAAQPQGQQSPRSTGQFKALSQITGEMPRQKSGTMKDTWDDDVLARVSGLLGETPAEAPANPAPAANSPNPTPAAGVTPSSTPRTDRIPEDERFLKLRQQEDEE